MQGRRVDEAKGIAPGPSFDLVVTDRLDVAGAAFVTSASASESAQESAELETVFTHYPISVLRVPVTPTATDVSRCPRRISMPT